MHEFGLTTDWLRARSQASPEALAVVTDGSAYTFETDSVDELTADWRCEVDNCTLDLEVSSSGVSAGGRAYDGTLTLDLVVDEALAVTGDASIVFTGDISCRHEMTVDGTIR